tara:strand:- start:9897 stop:10163 length:267 start_codon:yes stop_codon:yes gene_type:complete
MEMLSSKFVAGTLFVSVVGMCATGVTWISSTLIGVDKSVAVMSVKIDDNSQKIDELHNMLKPMWEEFTGRSYDDNIASFHGASVVTER